MTPVENFLSQLSRVKSTGEGWSAQCPAHVDRKPSLSVSEGEDGTVLIRCHTGCKPEAIVAAVGLKLADLFPPKPDRKPKRKGRTNRRSFPTAEDALAGLQRRHGLWSSIWTYQDIQGEPVGIVARWDSENGKDFRPVARNGDGWIIGAMADPRPLYALPLLVHANQIVVTEGEKAADAARGIGFSATTSVGGSQAAFKTDWRPLAGKEVWILPDNDPPGLKYADDVLAQLRNLTPTPVVRVVILPGLPEHGDIVDWIEAHGDGIEPEALRAEIEALALESLPCSEPDPGDLNGPTDPPIIVIGTDEMRVNNEAVAALARESSIYCRGGLLVHVIAQQETDFEEEAIIRRPAGAPVVRDLARPLLRERLSWCAHWVSRKTRPNGDEFETPAHPPDWSVGAVYARGHWPGVRPLDAVVSFPVMMPDGSILASNGYHKKAGVLVHLPADVRLSVPDRPTTAEVEAALQCLLDPLLDFPFETPAHRSALLAGLLTPLAWFLFDGPAPLFLIDKNVRGAGAGLLADVVALTVTGRRFSVMSYTNDREELRKRITTLALEGERLVLLDNLAGAVGNDILDAALTADTWKDRILGGNKVYDGPLHVVWFATGNNVQLHADTSRRVCHIRMESKDERPELRTGFLFPDLRHHLRQNRSAYLSAGLTILRSWILAGRPRYELKPWGSFEGWSGVVREALVFTGMPDPGDTRIALQTTADRDAAAMADILQGMVFLDPGRRGLTTAEILKRLKDELGQNDVMTTMRAAIEELCGKLDGRSLALRFRSFKRRNFNGLFLDVGGSAHGSNRWIVLMQNAQEGTNHPHYRPHHHPQSP